MKYLFICLCPLIFFACKKTDSTPGPNPTPTDTTEIVLPYTPVPASSPITTGVMIYTIGYNQSNTLNFKTNNSWYALDTPFNGYLLNNGSFDKYLSYITSEPINATGQQFGVLKTFPVTGTAKNYVNIKPWQPQRAGSTQFLNDVTISLPGNAELKLSPNSFPISPYYIIYADYKNPATHDYAVSLPCYPVGDENGKRWFLHSYGVYLLQFQAGDFVDYTLDFDPSTGGLLSMTIPDSLLSVAPDSIAAWHIDIKNQSHVWQKMGYAKKLGNKYEITIKKKGYWNFSIPADGVYARLHIKSSDRLPLPNTRFTLKSGNEEVADGRSDAEGNALVFVPTNMPLSATIWYDHFGGGEQLWKTLDVGVFSNNGEKDIVMPALRTIVPFEGKVFNCDGTNFGNGKLMITLNQDNDEYTTPIINGHFKMSQIINYSTTSGKIKIVNSQGNVLVTHNYALGGESPFLDNVTKYNPNFYACSNSAQLYCNYQLDSSPFELRGDTLSSTPVLSATKNMQTNIFTLTINNSGTGLSFQFMPVVGILGSSVNVNGTDYTTYSRELVFSRIDDGFGGFVEAWFRIEYADAGNSHHIITGNFRVKKNY